MRMASQGRPAQIERLERCIATAQRQIEAQELRLRQAAIEGRSVAVEEFDLQKMHLLLAILREGRERAIRQAARKRPATVLRLRSHKARRGRPEAETVLEPD
jgi:hypothetical protein